MPARDAAGQPIAVMDLLAQQERRAAAGGLDVRRAAEGRDRPQVHPGHQGDSSQTYPNGATVPLSPVRRPRSTSTSSCRCSTPPTRKGVSRRRRSASATRSRARGSDINDAIGAFVPLVDDLGPVARNLASKKTDLGGFFHGLESVLVRARAGRPDAGRPVRESRHHVHRAAPVAVPFLQEWISETPPTFSAVIPTAPAYRRS